MAAVTGTLSDGHKVLFQNLSMSLEPVGINKSFQGAFYLPPGNAFVGAGKSFRLRCSDGRSGTIRITSTHINIDQSQNVAFRTTGDFE